MEFKIDKEKCRSTFHPWRIYEPSNVKVIPKEQLEAEGYQSAYLFYFNYISDFGWKREKGKWTSPCGKYKIDRIYEAYRCQKYLEELRK